jgi:hypothetical protein
LGHARDENENIAARQTLLADLRASSSQHIFAGVGEDPAGKWLSEPSWLALGLDHES